jgi:AAA15 family ATPase/GTPase
MILIERVEIYYFRSIYTLKLLNLKDLCVLSGKNDSGKSNVLKALNLFFNNETDWKTNLDFTRDFSLTRLEEVRKETIKGRQFIRVKVYFRRGKRSVHSLPEKFFVTKTWYRDSGTPEIKSNIEPQFRDNKIKTKKLSAAQAGLQSFLNRIKYEYVPAIKDRNLSTYMLGLLQDTILQRKSGTSSMVEAVTNLNSAVEGGANELNREFEKVCGVLTDIRLPQELAQLFRAFSVQTRNGSAELPITARGDGIQTRFIPSLLYYVATNSRLIYLWGFEEPENCLEHPLATELAYNLRDSYSDKSQIILTSHSPAFIGLEGDTTTAFRIYGDTKGTSSICVYPSKDGQNAGVTSLKEELGLLQLEKEQQEEFEKRKRALQEDHDRLAELEAEFNRAQSPILLTEGKTDVSILETAWQKAYESTARRFRIISCSTMGDGSTAGAGILVKALESCRWDMPVTIGLFDRDKEGIKAFQSLDNNFKVLEDKPNVKVHSNNNAAAFLIPDLPGKEDYMSHDNLPLEFVFPEQYIEMKINGKGLECDYEKKVTTVGGKTIQEDLAHEPHFRRISRDSKTFFAEEVVPTFPPNAFANIKFILDEFLEIKRRLRRIARRT